METLKFANGSEIRFSKPTERERLRGLPNGITLQEYAESLTDEECDQIAVALGPTVPAADERFQLLAAIYQRRWAEHLLALLSA